VVAKNNSSCILTISSITIKQEKSIIMCRRIFITLSCMAAFAAGAQDLEVGLIGGSANYVGDLQPKFFNLKQAQPMGGLIIRYNTASKFSVRAGLSMAKLQAFDKLSDDAAQKSRNLNFQSNTWEFHLAGEYHIFDMYDKPWSPYVFAGVALFHFDPYTKDRYNNRVALQSVGTEGQKVDEHYKLNSFAIPLGVGVKVALNQDIVAGAEFGVRKTFTDYLDDVSGNYVSQSSLLAQNGPAAVALAFRGNEIPPFSAAYPAAGTARGTKSGKDWYYYAGIHLSVRLGLPNGGGTGYGKQR
jgi:Domain of unknown function (DUF6089)